MTDRPSPGDLCRSAARIARTNAMLARMRGDEAKAAMYEDHAREYLVFAAEFDFLDEIDAAVDSLVGPKKRKEP